MQEELNAEVVQDQFPEVVKLTEQSKLQDYKIYRGRLQEKLDFIRHHDNELMEMLDAAVASVIWLKEKHEKEGSITISYTKKKNVRGEAQAHITVSSKYSQSLNETDRETLFRTFLTKNFLIENSVEDTMIDPEAL